MGAFQTISDSSPLGYHGYDIYYYANRKETLTDTQKKMKLKLGLMKTKKIYQITSIKVCFKEKNVIALQVESLENFVIGKKSLWSRDYSKHK